MRTISSHDWLGRGRTLIIAIIAGVALLSATVAIGQSSQDFDLACRSIIAAGGAVTSGGDFALIGTLGVPIAPAKESETAPTYAVRSTDFGLRAGFLPAYPNGQRATVAAQRVPSSSEQAFVQRLPIVFKMIHLIRGGC